MNSKKLLFTLMFFSFFNIGFAQNYTQTIKGKITDKETGGPLSGVVVKMKSDSSGIFYTRSDTNGFYKIEKFPVGRRALTFSLIGYKQVVISDIIVISGKESVLNLEMEEQIIQIEEIVIKANSKENGLDLNNISSKTFSIAETERFAGSRQDPARMASNYAGVQGTDDSRNDIIIRGNSPSGLLWRLEEIDLPNPNHFNVAGSAGGSISMINNKYLANSQFFTGAFPASYGNALGGAFDLKMRNGNNETHERSFQFGLFGTELGFEGPISKVKGSSYLINYRYSTLDIFSSLNIPLGTSATPKYQDIGFRFNFPTKKAGEFSLSGIGGLSKIAIVLSKEKTPPKELYGNQYKDQYFETNMGVAILSHVISLGNKTVLKTSLAHSSSYINSNHYLIFRDANYIAKEEKPHVVDFNLLEQKSTITSYIRHKINSRNSIKVGLYVNHYSGNYNDRVKFFSTKDTTSSLVEAKNWNNRLNTQSSFNLIQPFLQFNHKFTDNITINTGLFSQFLTLNNTYSVEPRAGIKWDITDRQTLSFGYGLHSQIQPTYMYFAAPDSLVRDGKAILNNVDGVKVQDNLNIGMSKSQHFVLGYDFFLNNYLKIKAETYYQNLWDIPVYGVQSSFSLLNRGSGFNRLFPMYTMVNKGTGENYGIELTIEKLFNNHYFAMFSGSLFNSTYKGSNGIQWNTDFNGNFMFNLLGGIEYAVGKSKKNTVTIGPKLTYGGGKRYTNPNKTASDRIMDIVPQDSSVNELQFPDYFRADLRISYKINGKKASCEIAIDIVNLTKQRNVLALTYAPNPKDPTADPIIRNYQLGLMPIFYVKVDF